MKIVIRSTKEQRIELIEKGFASNIVVEWIDAADKFLSANADAFFDLSFNDTDVATNEFIDDKIVFVHAVNCVNKIINKPNYIRLNAWNGFINRPVIELVYNNTECNKQAEKILHETGWQYEWVADAYGLVAARIIAMIINEAYYAFEENVSSKQQIDIAMKLGTNYPYGPFEWSKKIGLINIYNLLRKLCNEDEQYTISPLLVQESQQF